MPEGAVVNIHLLTAPKYDPGAANPNIVLEPKPFCPDTTAERAKAALEAAKVATPERDPYQWHKVSDLLEDWGHGRG